MGDEPAAGSGEEADVTSDERDEGEQPTERPVDADEPTDGPAAAEPTSTSAVADSSGEDSDDADADATHDGSDSSDGSDGDVETNSPAGDGDEQDAVPADVRKYERFKKVDGAQYDRVNDFLRERTYITAREWAIARLCADFRTETGVEMTKIGNNLPELVPFMTDTYSPQAVNQARHAFREKVRKSGATFLYGAMCGFFTAEELDELMYEVSEIAKFLLEVEGVDLAVAEELEAEERISSVMREVRQASSDLRAEDLAESASE